MGEYKHYTDEQINEAKNIDLLEFVKSKGFQVEKAGREFRVKGFGGLMIKPDSNEFYIHSRNEGGKGAIMFCQKVMNMSFPEAMKELVGDSEGTHKSFTPAKNISAAAKPLEMPERNNDVKRVYAYLINQRKISADLISTFVKEKLLYQDKNGNAVFVHRNKNGEAVGAEIQGTLSEKRYKGVATGTSKSVCSYSKGSAPKTAYLFESAIDMMSFIQLHPEIDNAKFVSMAGLKDFAAEQLARQGMQIVSCVDNDEAGQAFNKKLESSGIGLQSVLSRSKFDFEMIHNDAAVYAKAESNGENLFFFQSKEDYTSVQSSDELFGRTFIAAHANEFFKVNDECAKNNVKDFNELLQLNDETQKFDDKCEDMEQWATEVIDKADSLEHGRSDCCK